MSDTVENPKTKRDWKPLWFEEQQKPLAWLITAQRLKRAAQVLFASQSAAERIEDDGTPAEVEEMPFQLDKPAMLLLAFAMENAIKAYLLDSGQIQWAEMQKSQKALPPDLKNKQMIWRRHDLTQLFELAAIPRNDEQNALLMSLSAFAIWAGRYPLDFDPRKCFLPALSFDEAGSKDQPKEEPPEELPPMACDSLGREKLERLLESVLAKVKQ